MSPSDIIASVSKSFAYAHDAGDLLHFPSSVTKHEELGIEFEIRLCPALLNKPTPPAPKLDSKHDEQKSDPFASPYNRNLHLGDLQSDGGEEYVVLLNKYAVVPDHFLVVTKKFQSQSSPLMPFDLVQTYLLLTAAHKAGKQYFAFYNCGDNSGASQAHKHIQFVPLEHDGPPIERVARSIRLETPDKPFSLTRLPYTNHVIRLPDQFSSQSSERIEQQLSTAFLALLDLVISAIRHVPEYPPGKPSYNVLMTLNHIHMIPRKRDAYTVPVTGEQVSVNALGFAGMLLVKSEEELEVMKTETIEKILRSVGLDSEHDIQTDVATEVE